MQHEKALARTFGPSNDNPADFSGKWVNELGSVMTLTQNGQALTGQYISKVSGDERPVNGPLSGWVDGQVISFTVNWPLPSITAWVGHLITKDGNDAIETLWQLATTLPDPNDPSELWESIFSGSDRFTRA